MQSRGKIAAVAAVLLVGVLAVVLFRKQPTTEPDAPAGEDPALVLRDDEPRESPSDVATPRLLGKIAPVDEPAAAPPRSSGDHPTTPVPATPRGDWPSRYGAADIDMGSTLEASPYGGSPAPNAPPPRREGPLHTIADGDTLSQLAHRYLGDAGRYLEIYDLNRGRLESPDLLPIGVELRMPPPDAPRRGLAPANIESRPLAPVSPRPGATARDSAARARGGSGSPPATR